ncbi:MAG: DUF748 domain-containing protein [Bacteroidetes bacterium]|nr:DUF748 domain-containing protein [Bacteroidota bacterium]
MKINTRLKKTTLIVTGSIIITVIVVILVISPIAKHLAIKYGEKYTGRHITTGWIYVNPFTGYVHISNLKIYERKNLPGYKSGDSILLSVKGVSADFAMLKLLSKTIEISEITLDRPNGLIIQHNSTLNFSDVITNFTPEKPRTTPSTVHFNILNIKIEKGEFYYREGVTPINYFIKDANFESTGKHWNADTMAIKFSFSSGPGSGTAKGNISINFKTLDYRLSAIVHKFDLQLFAQYLKVLINYGSFRANIDADVKATGNFSDQENLNLKGMVAVNDFHFGKYPDDDYASFDKLVLAMNDVSPQNHKYLFDSVSVSHPFVKYERYDYLDNVQMMFGKNGSNISSAYANPGRFNLILKIADYLKVLVKNFFQSYYRFNRLAIYNGDVKFNDYAISEKFSVDLNPLFIIADSVDKNHKRLEVSLKSGIQPYGNVSVNLSINPRNSSDFDMRYHLQRLPVSMFNPYLITYTSFPLDRGTIEFNGTWNVSNGTIQSRNHLLIIDPLVTKRRKNKLTSWIPTSIVMFFIRERGNVIDYEIPITGNLKNPRFHLHDVLVDMLENIFVKPATTAYRSEVKNMENEIEKSLTLKWAMRQNFLLPDQEYFVGKMVDFLVKNPEASISVYPIQYADKEKEYIRFFEAKKKYFLLSNDKNARLFSKADSLKVDKMSVKDTSFVRYLDKQVNHTLIFTIQEKCNTFVGSAFVNGRFNQLNKIREAVFMDPFRKKAVESRIKIFPGETSIPYNGFSFFKIVYKGEFPETLIKAYRKMNELNSVPPREKYKQERKQNKSKL